ncbi:MAG TPA: S8 family serine peptidase [Gaiellaceae bacterium]|nr:S8 family serine peptidase [Gaiellaceae bacterium]
MAFAHLLSGFLMRFLRSSRFPKSRRLLSVLIGTACAAALAASAPGNVSSHASPSAYVPGRLLSAARTHPNDVFRVILQGAGARGERLVVAAARTRGVNVERTLRTISGASAAVTGRQLLQLSAAKGVAAITIDRPVHLLDEGGDDSPYWSGQTWPYAVNAQRGWRKAARGKLRTAPAIAIVDSGIQSNRADFGNGAGVRAQVSMVSTGTPNSAGDGYGHGTFVAGIAGGSADGYAGTLPGAPLVSLDVLDDEGQGLTSDVIAATDWIVQHKAQYNIKVANFSLQSSAPASVFWDPLDRAVEKLWFDGITVVAASGNYGTADRPSGVQFAPGNDPFVITVGADDIGGTSSTGNDTAAPFSAWGYTFDGFAKPEISAPGRYMIGPVPDDSTLATTRPGSMVAPGYEQLSGTSFSAPVVSGVAAYLLALNPKWKPDDVKGAVMLSARPAPNATPGSVGAGLVDLAAAGEVDRPPNPNDALDKFAHPAKHAGPIPVFDTAAWQAAALKDSNWDALTWRNRVWNSAAWGSATWGSAAWGSAAWGSAAWGSAAWGSSTLAQQLASGNAAWGSAAWGSATSAEVPDP